MLNLVKGYKICAPEKLNEGYEITSEMAITANVNAEKILDVFQHFILRTHARVKTRTICVTTQHPCVKHRCSVVTS